MKCNQDCFNCTRPAEKCHGGDFKAALKWRNANRMTDGKGFEAKQDTKFSNRVWTGGKRNVDL